MRDLDAELNNLDDATPESWRPKPGDRLVGTLIGYAKLQGGYGPCWVATVRVAATPTQAAWLAGVWLSHKVLLEEFRRLRPRPGERIGIRRLADRETKDHQGYAVYRLIVDRNEAELAPPWDALDAPEPPPPASPSRPPADDVPF